MSPSVLETRTDPLSIDMRPPVRAPHSPVDSIVALREDWPSGDSLESEVHVHMHPVTLRFDDNDLEREFQDEFFQRTLGQSRVALVVGLLLYSLYGIVDVFLARPFPFFWATIRYLLVAPAALGDSGSATQAFPTL
jgi:hypothetical protein